MGWRSTALPAVGFDFHGDASKINQTFLLSFYRNYFILIEQISELLESCPNTLSDLSGVLRLQIGNFLWPPPVISPLRLFLDDGYLENIGPLISFLSFSHALLLLLLLLLLFFFFFVCAYPFLAIFVFAVAGGFFGGFLVFGFQHCTVGSASAVLESEPVGFGRSLSFHVCSGYVMEEI